MKKQYQKKQYTCEVEVVFGNPQLECDRFGICKIIEMNHLELHQRAFQRAAATCHYKPAQKQLTISFWQKSLSEATRKHYFGRHYFLVEKNCTPTLLLEENSVLPQSLLIVEGLYPIDFENDDFLSLTVNILTANNEQVSSEKVAARSY